MDRATIEFNYSRAQNLASSIVTNVEKINSLDDKRLKVVMQLIADTWEGENSQKYIAKCETVLGTIIGVAGSAISVAATINEIARNIYEAEMEALRIEEERAYQARLAAEEAERKAREEAAKANKNKTGGGGGGHVR